MLLIIDEILSKPLYSKKLPLLCKVPDFILTSLGGSDQSWTTHWWTSGDDNDDDDDDDDDDDLFLWNVCVYFQPRPLSEIITIANLQKQVLIVTFLNDVVQ